MLTLLTFCSAVGDSILSKPEAVDVASSPEFELEPSEVLLHKYQLMSITKRATTKEKTFWQTRKYITGNLWSITGEPETTGRQQRRVALDLENAAVLASFLRGGKNAVGPGVGEGPGRVGVQNRRHLISFSSDSLLSSVAFIHYSHI